MISNYISKWLQIIEEMSNDNTYKLAWGRAIIECNSQDEFIVKEDTVTIMFDSISEKMLKYYWNQCFFFNLKQSPYNEKKPVIQVIAEEVINKYKDLNKTSIPVWFDKGYECLMQNDKRFYEKAISKISTVLHQNVSFRFKRVPLEVLDIYEYDKSIGSFITISKEQSDMLKDYANVISQLLNYKWVQLLERFNYAPKIASKVKGISDNKLRRNSLSKYKDELLKEFKDSHIIDFYTGEELQIDDVSVDHVIPWSFVYSDDIWNLVVTSKSNNSSKSNSIPTENTIKRLEDRNKLLVDYIGNEQMKNDILYSIANNNLTKLYFDCRL